MATPQDAELILKLYELRTEPTMRKARKWMGAFEPASFDVIQTLLRDKEADENAYWRQVLSYWDMAASFVLHGALDAELFAATNGEPVFLYAKFAAFHADWLKLTGRPFMPQVARLIEQTPALQERYAHMVARQDAAKKQAAG